MLVILLRIIRNKKMQVLAKIQHSGRRITKTRRVICNLLRKARSPITRLELCHQSAGFGISRSTVYRTLHMLVAEKLVEVSENGKSEPCFELARERHHHHLRCNICGRCEDVRCHVPAKTLRRWEREYSFHITNHAGDVFGWCSRCVKKGHVPS